MDDKATDQRDAFMGRVWESEMALQHDLQNANEDAAKAQIKRTAFLSYRDANKLVSYSLICRNVGHFYLNIFESTSFSYIVCRQWKQNGET